MCISISLPVIVLAISVGLYLNSNWDFEDPRGDINFRKYDYVGKQKISSGTYDVPFRSYKSDPFFFSGYADLDQVKKLLNKDDYYPVVIQPKKTLALLAILEHHDSDCGAYAEAFLTFFVSKKQNHEIFIHNELSPLRELYFDPEVRPFVWKIWLNETLPTNYGREILGIDKYQVKSEIIRTEHELHFSFKSSSVAIEGKFLFKSLAHQIWYHFGLLPKLLSALGWRHALLSVLADELTTQVVLPKNVIDPKLFQSKGNPVVELIMRGLPAFFEWTSESDHISISDSQQTISFEPFGCVHIPNAKMVVLPPWNAMVKA